MMSGLLVGAGVGLLVLFLAGEAHARLRDGIDRYEQETEGCNS